jgi:hypothetical protein
MNLEKNTKKCGKHAATESNSDNARHPEKEPVPFDPKENLLDRLSKGLHQT